MKKALNMGDEPNIREEDYSVFTEPWCKTLLSHPNFQDRTKPGRRPPPPLREWCTNTIYSKTLWTDDTIPSWCEFQLPDPSNAAYPYEYFIMLAVGSGLDGMTGRAHGGLVSMILDTVTAYCSEAACQASSTLELEVKFKKGIKTPCLLLARAKVVRIEGAKCWTDASLEDGKGTVFATVKSLYLRPKGVDMSYKGDPRGRTFSQEAPKGSL